jgi:hypothetical protein
MKPTHLRMSKQAEDFWKMLRTYPKQIEMPLAQAREADRRSEDFTSEPADVTFRLPPMWVVFGPKLPMHSPGERSSICLVEDLCSAHPAPDGRPPDISPWLRKRACWYQITGSRPNIHFRPRSRTCCELTNGSPLKAPNHREQWWPAIRPGAASRFQLRWRFAIEVFRCRPESWRFRLGPTSVAAAKA